MAEPARAEPRYRAFLSYSHKDADEAARIHRRLEGYRLPKRLVGRETERGPVPRRLLPIFRDREELAASSDLSETVRAALEQSAALVVLCSPASAASLWVAEEIATFRAIHPDRPVLAAIIAGEPPGCFPAPLRGRDPDGAWHEPLATDMRREGDGRHLGMLKLVAGLTGVGLDDLVQRDAHRRVRRVTAVTGIAVAAMLIMAALTVFALDARREAERQRAEAKGLSEFMLTDLRERLREVGRLDVLTEANRRALAYYDRQRRLTSRDALMRARVLHAMGEDDLQRGDRNAAMRRFREAFQATERLLAQHSDDPDVIFAHSQSEYWVGYADYRRGNRQGMRQAWLRYKVLADRLIAAEPRNTRWLREVGYAEGNLCTIAVTEESRDSLRICSSALERMAAARRLAPTDRSIMLDVANRHGWIADSWNLVGRWDRVLHHRSEQEQLIRWLLSREPDNLDYHDFWMRTQFSFGLLLEGHGQQREARQWFAAAAETAGMLRRRDPQNESWRSFQNRISEATR